MSIQIEYLIEGKFSLNSLLESGVSSASIAEAEKTLGLPIGSRADNLFFVGLIELDNKVFISFPKSLDIDSITDNDVFILISLMRSVSNNANLTNKIPDGFFFKKTHDIEKLSRLNLAEFLIFDFLKDGDITFKNTKNIINRSHDPDWTRTINDLLPIVSKSGPVYDKWFSKKRSIYTDNVIKQIHRTVFNDCINKYGQILGFNADKTLIQTDNITLPKNAQRLIDVKLRDVYVQRDILALKAIKNWLQQNNQDTSLEFYGTRYFHIVWEEICSFLLNDNKHIDHWKSAFKKPIWQYYDFEQTVLADPFEVDVISEIINGKLILADAKYYDISKRSRGILSINDVSKQINYETQLVKSPDFISRYGSEENLINLFIFPAEKNSQFCKVFCSIEFPNLYNRKLQGVSLDTLQAFDRYLSQKPLSCLEIQTILPQSH